VQPMTGTATPPPICSRPCSPMPRDRNRSPGSSPESQNACGDHVSLRPRRSNGQRSRKNH
jgi:hypothetical protein